MTSQKEKATPTAATPNTTNLKDTSTAAQCNRLPVHTINFTDLRSENKLDQIEATGLQFNSCGDSRVRFSDLNTLSERNRPLIISVPFFMLTLGLQLVCRVLGGLCPAGFLECRFANLTPDAPFLFSDEKGVYITLGGSL